MNSTDIVNRIDTIQQSLRWKGNVPITEQLTFQERLINLRREYKKTKFALDERPSVAAFGESQMGKSYLVSAMLSSPNVPFRVTDGTMSYHFIDEINPSSPNSTIEATNGYAMYFSNCPNATINYKGTNNISGSKGKIFGTVTENTIQ